MDSIELITKLKSGEIKDGTKLAYTFKDSDNNIVHGGCEVCINSGLAGLFRGRCTIGTVALINSDFEIIDEKEYRKLHY